MSTDTTGPICPHGIAYGGIEQCGDCRRAKASSAKQRRELVDTTAKRKLAVAARNKEDECWKQCVETTRDFPVYAVKWSAESAKWARIAMDLEKEISEYEHHQWLVELDRERRGS